MRSQAKRFRWAGAKGSEKVAETEAKAGIHCTSQSARGNRRIPTNRINEWEYEAIQNSWGKWIWLDGAWRETRNPTMGEVKKIDGATQTLGLGEFAVSTYVEVLTYNPKYVEYLMNEGERSFRYEEIHRADHEEGGSIIVEVEQLPSAERSGMRRNFYRPSRIWILDNARGKSRGINLR